MKNALIALMLGLFAPALALASDGPWYAAVDAGQTTYKDACSNIPAGVSVASCKNTATAYRIAGGYQFTPIWGAELSYADLGKSSGNGAYLGFPFNVNFKATALQLSGTGTYAINQAFSIFGKVGVVNSHTTVDTTVPGIIATSAGATKTTVGFGVGVVYNINPHIGIRAQYENLGQFGDTATTGTSNIDLLTAGLVYRF